MILKEVGSNEVKILCACTFFLQLFLTFQVHCSTFNAFFQGESSIIFILCHCTPPSQHPETDFSALQQTVDGRRRKQTENGEKSRVSVSHLQTSARIFLFFNLLLLWTLYRSKMLVFDILGMKLINQLPFWCVFTNSSGKKNPPDSHFKFNSL